MIKNPFSGKLISFDGLDGSGLSTQSNLLRWFLEKQGIEVFLTHYPTEKSAFSSKISQIMNGEIAADPIEFHQLIAQDRKEDFKNWVIPALQEGKWVLTDHYVFASLAFGPENESQIPIYEEMNKDFFLPDLGFVILVKPETSMQRIINRGKKIQKMENLVKLRIAYDNFQIILKKYDFLKPIDGEQSIEDVHEKIKTIVKAELFK